jgi:uncharacterized protein HemX
MSGENPQPVQPAPQTEPARITKQSTVSLGLLITVVVAIIGAAGWGKHQNDILIGIKDDLNNRANGIEKEIKELEIEIKLLRQELNYHAKDEIHDGAASLKGVQAYIRELRAANPEMNIPDYNQ